MKEKNSFLLYNNYKNQFDLLSDEQAGKLIKNRYKPHSTKAQFISIAERSFFRKYYTMRKGLLST